VKSILSFVDAQKSLQERRVFDRWVEHFASQAHEDLLNTLVLEHENDFPMRRSANLMEQIQHRALIHVLNERAQSEFLKHFLKEIQDSSVN
jgi:hypothetical protein